jgi:hypothetical protein
VLAGRGPVDVAMRGGEIELRSHFLSTHTIIPPPVRTRGPCTATDKCRFQILADLDQQSKVKDAKKLTFVSILKGGEIWRDSNGEYRVDWEPDVEIKGHHNEAGRGMELSELIMFDG